MILTEEEAKQRWCPFSNVHIPHQNTGAGGNRALGSAEHMQGWKGNALCLASACMSWRWHERTLGHDPAYKGADAAAAYSAKNLPRGYCGLAGKP